MMLVKPLSRGAFLRVVMAALCLFPTVTQAQGRRVVASYYGYETHGKTADGSRFNPTGFTAASRTLAFGTLLRVTYHHHSTVVRINDRGPFIRGRSLDLSLGAARAIGLAAAGVGVVAVEIQGDK
jgi:rare lipoprotein A